ncbi:hypothetical protein M902_0525 [Bacteriovorax sp. BAL6_X]|nr:hypothetical protein M902_0525 [Bacteriovorax sp. BAL6_X]
MPSNIIHYKSKADYESGIKSEISVPEKLAKDVTKVVEKTAKVTEAAAKASISTDALAIAQAGKKLAVDAVTTIAKSAVNAPEESSEAEKVAPVKELLPINRPAIFFLEGLHLSTLSSKGGLEDIAKSFSDGEFVSWNDEDKVFEDVLRRPKDQPIILVGHSLGGDAVVNLANRLNSAQAGFREVNLLVTLDSVGFDNDIIPKNVKKNLNFMLDRSFIFNDGPNVARDFKTTDVINILRPEGHTKIDEAADVHREIFQEITQVLDQNYLAKRKQQLAGLYRAFYEMNQQNNS